MRWLPIAGKVIHTVLAMWPLAPCSALASATNVLAILGPPTYQPLDYQKSVEFRNALCEDAQQTRERAPVFTKQMQETLARKRAAFPPLGTEGFTNGVTEMADTTEVALETIEKMVKAVLLECDRTAIPDLRFWVDTAAALSDQTFDTVVTNLERQGIILRRPYEHTTAIFIARQLMLEMILNRIVKPQMNR